MGQANLSVQPFIYVSHSSFSSFYCCRHPSDTKLLLVLIRSDSRSESKVFKWEPRLEE